MGDNAEFEKLTTLEARLAAALDRIAVGLGESHAAPPIEDPGLTSGALEDAQIRAEAAEARVAELQQHIAQIEAQPQAASDDAATLAALEADRASLSARIAILEAEAAEAVAAPEPVQDTAMVQKLETRIAELETAVEKARKDRDAAIAERDEARDIAEEMQAASGVTPDDRALELRNELTELRDINERLTKNLSRMRSDQASDPRVLNRALLVELDALKAARASEAAELQRILADLDPALNEGGAHA